MTLQNEIGLKWANLSRVCTIDVEDYTVNQPEVYF